MNRADHNSEYHCPFDGCPLRMFAVRPVTLGYTIRLLGCRYCNFNHVVAVAADAGGNARFVGLWQYNSGAGLYVLTAEHDHNPPGWLDASAAALPQRTPA